MKVAVTKWKGGLTDVDIISANEWLFGQLVDVRLAVDFYKNTIVPTASADGRKINSIWLDNAIHRKRLSTHNLSVFTSDRDEIYKVTPATTTLRGYQSFPNMPIGEVVVYTTKKDFIDRYGKTTARNTGLTQGAYTLLHEITHWWFDLLEKKDNLHDRLNRASKRGRLYEELATIMSELLKEGVKKKYNAFVKYTPAFTPVKRPLTNYFANNDPRSVVFHTLAGSIEGSYAWLDQIKLSYNYLISKQGRVYEMVHWSHGAWHAGRVNNPILEVVEYYGQSNPNQKSVGVAFERKGETELTKYQVASAVSLLKWLGQQTGYTYSYNNMFSHVEIAADKPVEVLNYRDQVYDNLIGEKVTEPPNGTELQVLQQSLITLLKIYLKRLLS